jgi:hypothetical protein
MQKYLAAIRKHFIRKPMKSKQGTVDNVDGKIHQDMRVSSRLRDSSDRGTERKREGEREGRGERAGGPYAP